MLDNSSKEKKCVCLSSSPSSSSFDSCQCSLSWLVVFVCHAACGQFKICQHTMDQKIKEKEYNESIESMEFGELNTQLDEIWEKYEID